MEGYQKGGGGGELEEVQGIRSVKGRYKKDREVRTAEEMEKPKNLCV